MWRCVVVLGVAAAAPAPMDRVVSDESAQLAPAPAVAWTEGSCPASASVSISDDHLQEVRGFGASMTESSAININALPDAKKTELLELLFGPSGARFSALKATMLSNDFAAQEAHWATYDDVVNDTKLEHFSIERDLRQNGTLSALKMAQTAGFDGTIQAYMDYPPDWMLAGPLPDGATVKPELYGVLANYFAKRRAARMRDVLCGTAHRDASGLPGTSPRTRTTGSSSTSWKRSTSPTTRIPT